MNTKAPQTDTARRMWLRRRREIRPFLGTIFYPRGDADDRVTAIGPTRPVRFQPIVPRYELSTNATRDTGLGPLFDAGSDWASAPRKRAQVQRAVTARVRCALMEGLGSRLDVDA